MVPDVVGARAKRLERLALAEQKKRLAEARQAWQQLSHNAQMRLACEAVETRGSELRAAYPDAVQIGYGYRDRGRGKGRHLVRRPCVTFMVAKKWEKGHVRTPAERARAMPRELLAYAVVDRRRRLVCIPTDVVGSDGFACKPSAKSYEQIDACDDAAGGKVQGVICCAVRAAGNKLYAIGCHHVLALSLTMTQVPQKVTVYEFPAANAQRLGELSPYYGVMQPGFSECFDAALVDPAGSLDVLKRCVGLVETTKAYKRGELPDSYIIRTPSGPLYAAYARDWPWLQDVEYAWGPQQIRLGKVIELRVYGGITAPGDSGSPVVGAMAEGGKFAGMHIAGAGTRAVMIPAFELLRSERFGLPGSPTLLSLAIPPFKA